MFFETVILVLTIPLAVDALLSIADRFRKR